jgi:hypothetical protein
MSQPRKDLLAVEYKDGDPSPFVVNASQKTKPDIRRVEPSALLSRAMAFLPEMERANQELEERIARGEDVNVENVADDEEHVEIDVALGPMVNESQFDDL